MYYLSPAEANDREPYHLMVRAMDDADRLGVGQVVFSGKKQLVALRTYQNVLVMEMLNYAPELRDAKALGISTERAKVSTQGLRLAKALITSLESERFSIEDYEDSYRADVKRLLNAKKKGEVVAEPETEEEGSIINLMDALKRSVGSKGKKKRAKRTSA
jgi:DNA end-binding protein Ku